jgi:3-dehydroquinate dehydratase-2
MNLLILHGPNTNLIGSISAKNGDQVTLSKIDSKIKFAARKSNVNIKTLQTHKVFSAINFIQRNRNWANGLLFNPASWSKYEYSLLECLTISNITTVQIVFNDKYNISNDEPNSIFNSFCKKTINGNPLEVYIDGIKEIQKII